MNIGNYIAQKKQQFQQQQSIKTQKKIEKMKIETERLKESNKRLQAYDQAKEERKKLKSQNLAIKTKDIRGVAQKIKSNIVAREKANKSNDSGSIWSAGSNSQGGSIWGASSSSNNPFMSDNSKPKQKRKRKSSKTIIIKV